MLAARAPGDGPIQVLHFQPEKRALPRCPPDRLCGSLRSVRVHGRRFPQGHPTEYHQDAGVGRTGEILIHTLSWKANVEPKLT